MTKAKDGPWIMVELIRTNDPVLISWLVHALAEEGINAVVLDTHASIMDGSISAIPRRIMVDGDAIDRARWLVHEAETLSRQPTS